MGAGVLILLISAYCIDRAPFLIPGRLERIRTPLKSTYRGAKQLGLLAVLLDNAYFWFRQNETPLVEAINSALLHALECIQFEVTSMKILHSRNEQEKLTAMTTLVNARKPEAYSALLKVARDPRLSTKLRSHACSLIYDYHEKNHIPEELRNEINELLDLLKCPPPDLGKLRGTTGNDPDNQRGLVLYFNTQGGDIVSEKKITKVKGQVGNIGDNNIIEQMNYYETLWDQNAKDLDLAELASELERLEDRMRTLAKTSNEYESLAEIAHARESAMQAKGGVTLEHLKKAGKWALAVAQDIGVGLAVAALKVALGL